MDNQKTQEALKKEKTEDDLRAEFEATVNDRADRFLEIGHQNIIAAHHFSQASSECLLLYRDGYFIATVMMSQAINEAIIKLVAERNTIELKTHVGAKSTDALVSELKQAGKISNGCEDAALGIYGSFRNDVHHMNPKIAHIDFVRLAVTNIRRLATIEQEIFAFEIEAGAISPKNPIYWDAGSEGYAAAFLRIGF